MSTLSPALCSGRRIGCEFYMKTSSLTLILVSVITLTTVLSIFLMYQLWVSGPEDARLTEAKIQTQIENLKWYSAAYKVAFVAVLTVLLMSVLFLAYSMAQSRLKKASVHTYKIGKNNEVVVHEKDLSLAAPIAMGLMNAEQLKQMNGGVERAFELYTRMAEVQTKQMQAIVGRKGMAQMLTPTDTPAQPLPASAENGAPMFTQPVPTFRTLLESGEISRGKPMILGFENGQPRRGSFLDIYSAAVAGESGSGKTATLLYLIASGLVSGAVRYVGIDPHYPHPKSLGFKTKPLWENGLMKMATYKDDMLVALKEVEQTIDRRLKQIDKDDTPMVLVIDELAFLAKTSIGSAVAHTMERISTEGRKCAVYMLASSQTWLVARTGDSSAVRDTLTSAFVHRIKPKQANLLLQDKDEAEKVKRFLRQPGDVLLCPVGDDSAICKMPFTTDSDMEFVAEMLRGEAIDVTPQPEALQGTPSQKPLPQWVSAPFDANLLTVDVLKEKMEASPFGAEGWQKQICAASGVSEKLLAELLAGRRKLTIQTAKKLVPYLFDEIS